jgi:hypothetical protein
MFMLGVFILNEEANVIKVASFSVGGCLVSLGIFIVSIAVFGGVAAKLKRSFFLEIVRNPSRVLSSNTTSVFRSAGFGCRLSDSFRGVGLLRPP